MEPIDELFAEEGARSKPRLMGALILVITGVSLAVVGLVCSSAPGGLLVLLGLLRIETERRRVESGGLPQSARPAVDAALRVAYVAMALVVVLFVVQTALLCLGVYQPLWGSAFYTLRALLGVG